MVTKSYIWDNSLILLQLESDDSFMEVRCPHPMPLPSFESFTERLQIAPEMND
jgi:hypothetical protein